MAEGTPITDLGSHTKELEKGPLLRKRTVPLEVLVLGLSRTATTSIRAALLKLSYSGVYDYNSVHQNNSHDVPFWIGALRGKYEGKRSFDLVDWDNLLGEYMAVSDSPCNIFAQELIAHYPEAKVILTVRDNVDVWYKSFLDTIWVYLRVRLRPRGLIEHVQNWTTRRQSNAEVLEDLTAEHTPMGNFPEQGKAWYLEHNLMVRSLVPEERFLEFNVKEGWGPLCRFLGKEIPDGPFPRLNDSGNFMRHLAPAMERQRKHAVILILQGITVAIIISGILLALS